jgi:Fe-S-cluster-containing hydrogenase component 2
MRRRSAERAPVPVSEQIWNGSGTGILLVLCGEQLGSLERSVLSGLMVDQAPAAGVVIVEDLCRQPSRIKEVFAWAAPVAVVVAGCDTAGALGAAREAVQAGVDSARCAAVSLSTAVMTGAAPQLLEAVCLGASRRAEALANEPAAGFERLQFSGSIGRRELLSPWRLTPRRSASIDQSRCLGPTRCQMCTAACSAVALRPVDGSLQVDPLRCSACGACALACPAGAISVPGAALDPLGRELEALLDAGVRQLGLACEQIRSRDERALAGELGTSAVLVGLLCVSTLCPGLLLALLAAGCHVDVLPCSSCREEPMLARTVAFVQRILGALGREDLAAQLNVGGPVKSKVPVGSRRVAHQFVAKAEQPHSLRLREPAATNSALASLLAGKTECHNQGMIIDNDAPGGIVVFNRRTCTFCGACALACPTGAITSDSHGGLVVDAIACSACGRCVSACPEHAVSVVRGVDLDGLKAGKSDYRSSPSKWTAIARGDADPMLASVLSRLAEKGANAALLSGLRRNTG